MYIYVMIPIEKSDLGAIAQPTQGQQCPKQRAVMISQTLAASGLVMLMGFHGISRAAYNPWHVWIYIYNYIYTHSVIYIYIIYLLIIFNVYMYLYIYIL